MPMVRTAVVGSGIAGLTAAYVLPNAHEVTLYEAADRLGGHAHTHDLASADGRVHQVDSGFIVHNTRTYPHLLRLFDELGVATQESEMSMSVRCAGCGLEYAGARGPSGLFGRPRNAVSARYLRLLAEVPRFHARARRPFGNDIRHEHLAADSPVPPRYCPAGLGRGDAGQLTGAGSSTPAPVSR